ncbi:HTTM domain-containing protein [Leucobacter sp. HNU]|uniref:HTTM domain-containing protein n=1 Tax=Leucobacter sp. HNU TaxID=3236805 RepID=UPI003A80FA7B
MNSALLPFRIWSRAHTWMTAAPHAVAALGLLRSVIGICGLAFYLEDYGNRRLLHGPEGYYGHDLLSGYFERSSGWSVYLLSDSLIWFEFLFHVGILVTILIALGVGGRGALGLHFVLLWSLFMTNPMLLDGGDNLMMIVVPFLLLTRCFDRFRIHRPIWTPGPAKWNLGTVAHNTGLLLIAGQVCIVYLMAGLYKVQGQLWQDGTAIYYILRTPEFFWPGITEIIFHFDWLIVLASYATVLTSIAFPVLVLFPAGRPIAVALMAAFHLAIGILMGLTSFALIMIAIDLLFVNQHVVRAAGEIRLAIARRLRFASTETALA